MLSAPAYAVALLSSVLCAAKVPKSFAPIIEKIDIDLACSACALSTDSLRRGFSSKLKAGLGYAMDLYCRVTSLLHALGPYSAKSWRDHAPVRVGRKALVQEVMDLTCGVDRFPNEVVVLGSSPRWYQDYAAWLEKFQTPEKLDAEKLEEWDSMGEMGIRHRENVREVCSTMLEELREPLLQKAMQVKRPSQYNWEKFLCVRGLDLCNNGTVMHKTDEDDDDQDDDHPSNYLSNKNEL